MELERRKTRRALLVQAGTIRHVQSPMLHDESAAQLRSLIDKGVLGGGVFDADDIHKTYEELKARGVEFKGPPSVQDWGTATVMKDNSGNWFSLSQHKEAAA